MLAMSMGCVSACLFQLYGADDAVVGGDIALFSTGDWRIYGVSRGLRGEEEHESHAERRMQVPSSSGLALLGFISWSGEVIWEMLVRPVAQPCHRRRRAAGHSTWHG